MRLLLQANGTDWYKGTANAIYQNIGFIDSYDPEYVIIKGHSFQEIALFVAKRLSPLDDVLSTATSFVLRPYKRGGKLYLNEEADERECTVL